MSEVLKKKKSNEVELKKKFEVELSSQKKLKITITQGTETILRKAKILIGHHIIDSTLRTKLHDKEENLRGVRREKLEILKRDGADSSLFASKTKRVNELRGEIRDLLKEIQKMASGDNPEDAIPLYKNIKDEKGEFITHPQEVPGVRIKVKFDDDEVLVARSCCKPPDVFKALEGKKIALKRIFQLDRGVNPATGKIENKDRNKHPRFTRKDKEELKLIFRRDFKNDQVIKIGDFLKKKPEIET